MSDKKRFSFYIRPDEREILVRLAALADRSESATIRLLIRNAARELTPVNNFPSSILEKQNTQAVQDASR
jgi:hypothetical protein